MDESRKRILLISAPILAARKLAQLNRLKPSPAFESIISDAISTAERIMQRIDAKYPANVQRG